MNILLVFKLWAGDWKLFTNEMLFIWLTVVGVLKICSPWRIVHTNTRCVVIYRCHTYTQFVRYIRTYIGQQTTQKGYFCWTPTQPTPYQVVYSQHKDIFAQKFIWTTCDALKKKNKQPTNRTCIWKKILYITSRNGQKKYISRYLNKCITHISQIK